MRNVFYFFGLLVATFVTLLLVRKVGVAFDVRQIASILIFCTFIYGTLLFGEFRLAFAFGGIALLMACNLISVERFTQSASLDVVVFLIGTFLVIGFLEEAQFFEHVVSGVVGAVGARPKRLLLMMMVMASISSALVGEVTAILFMAGAMLHLTSRYKLQPAPFIIMLVFSCNIGSAMTAVGNPIGVLIALKTGLTFIDFVKWSAPIALVVNVATYLICRWWFADAFHAFSSAVKQEYGARRAARPALVAVGAAGGSDDQRDPDGAAGASSIMSDTYFSPGPSNTIDGLDETKTYRLCWVILLALVVLLLTHGLSERWLGQLFSAVRLHPDGSVARDANGAVLYGLKDGTMLIGSALLMGSVVLLLSREKARELVERRVDWWTLAFFMMLFASVGTLEDTHVTRVIAERLRGTGASQAAGIQIIGWSTGWLSAFLDNVLAVATFMPVVHDLRAATPEPYSSSVYWFMLFGGTFMGNMTLIGSTANIVAVGLLEKRGHGTIRFGYWIKIGFIVSIASMLIATVMLFAVDHLVPGGIPRLPPPVGSTFVSGGVAQ